MERKPISQKAEECCGCGVCSMVCPVNAISMAENEYGFSVPIVDQSLCINCGICNSKCAFIHHNAFQHENFGIVFAAALKDEEVLIGSASGGVFAGLALRVIDDGGIVFGAAWAESFSVKHKGISSKKYLNQLQGSKYTQSDAKKSYKEVEELLNAGKKVLFSGTPCHVAALKSYLGKEYSGLITVDLICHGVASNRMLQDDVKYLEKKYGKRIKRIAFRTKRTGWGTSGDIQFDDNTLKNYTTIVSPYYYYYLGSAIFRESCYNCPFACGYRTGDITIGDYWRVESAHSGIPIDLEKGISCVLINTNKGETLFNQSKCRFNLIESDYEKISNRNGQLVSPCSCPAQRAVILKKYAEEGYDAVCNYWKIRSLKQRAIQLGKSCVPKTIKAQVKRHLHM